MNLKNKNKIYKLKRKLIWMNQQIIINIFTKENLNKMTHGKKFYLILKKKFKINILLLT